MKTLNATYNSKSVRLSRQILEDIHGGKYRPGEMLPIQDHLAEEYGTSRATLRRAMNFLTQEGNLHKHPQRGAVVPVRGKWRTRAGMRVPCRRKSPTEQKVVISAMWAAMQDYPAMKIFEGMKNYADSQQLDFTSFLTRRHEEVLEALDNIEHYPTEGVFLYPYRNEQYNAAIQKLVERRFPVVATRTLRDMPVSTVRSSDDVAGYQITHYLIETYHRPVYYLCEPVKTEMATDRRLGYVNAMVDAGYEDLLEEYTCRYDVPDSDPDYWNAEKKWLPGFHAADKLLDRIQLPATIAAVNDWVARGVYEAAKKHKLVIGKDLMVAGTSDLPMARRLKPALTTVNLNCEKLGIEAARLLHRLIVGEVQPPVHVRVPTELVVRESA